MVGEQFPSDVDPFDGLPDFLSLDEGDDVGEAEAAVDDQAALLTRELRPVLVAGQVGRSSSERKKRKKIR